VSSLRVLHLVKTSVGASWALEQMRVQRELGHDVHVMLPGDGPLVERYRAAGIVVHYLNLEFPELVRRPLTARRALRELLGHVAPDLLHSHFVQMTLAARFLLGRFPGIPRVFQVAGPLHLEHVPTRYLDVWSAGPLDYWVAACELSRTLLVKGGVSPERIALAYHGIDASRFFGRPSGRLRGELGLAPDVPIIGMVAYMYAPKRVLGQSRGLKGHEDLIDAIAALAPPFDNTVGVFIGGAWGERAKGYAELVKEYGRRKLGKRAVFLGTRTDVLDLYPDFDVAVHPSHSENLGGAVESMMLARPTIATTVGGFPDIVVPGATGWLVPAKNPAKLAAAIMTVLGNPIAAQELAEKGKTFVSNKLDIEAQTRKLVEFYQAVVDRKRSSDRVQPQRQLP
jgi:glycosyltransferase involved in cell wall biosynthesis